MEGSVNSLCLQVDKAQGWMDHTFFFWFFLERQYIGIKAPRSSNLVFWVLLLLYCVTFGFQIGKTIKVILRRKGMSWLISRVYGVEFCFVLF